MTDIEKIRKIGGQIAELGMTKWSELSKAIESFSTFVSDLAYELDDLLEKAESLHDDTIELVEFDLEELHDTAEYLFTIANQIEDDIGDEIKKELAKMRDSGESIMFIDEEEEEEEYH